MPSRFRWLLLALGAVGGVGSLTKCAEGSVPVADAGPMPACEDAGGRAGANCPCDPKTYGTKVCFSGPASAAAVGSCKTGMRSCNPDTHLTTACVGEVTPKPETCNLADDDCNGIVDDAPGVANASVLGWCSSPGCDPDHGDAAITCFSPTKQGLCGAGAVVCASGGKTECKAFGISATEEVCNNVDDDCNGTVDDLMTDLGPCEMDGGVGECAHGATQCVAGAQLCQGSKPAMETCDGKDNDCNGKTDDKSCTTGMAVYCCQNLSSQWGCTSTPNDGQHKSCSVGL